MLHVQNLILMVVKYLAYIIMYYTYIWHIIITGELASIWYEYVSMWKTRLMFILLHIKLLCSFDSPAYHP